MYNYLPPQIELPSAAYAIDTSQLMNQELLHNLFYTLVRFMQRHEFY